MAAFKAQLTPRNVGRELFSETAGTYDEVLDVVMDYFSAHREEAKKSKQWKESEGRVEELPWSGKVGLRLANRIT